MLCPRCQTAIAEGARSCTRCGMTLLAAARIARRAAPAHRAVLRPRRLDRALGSPRSGGSARGHAAPISKYVGETVARFGGFVAQYIGDGVLVYFGWPQANEHDAERAVRAGLALVDGVARPCLAARRRARDGPRVGICHRPRPGRIARHRGDTPNLAARLQAQAEPNTVVIAPATLSLVRGLFEYRDLGARPLKGFAEPVPVWQVVGESKRGQPFRRAARPSLGAAARPRRGARACCCGDWQEAKKGEGRVVLLIGRGRHRQVAADARAARKRRGRAAPAAALFLLAASHRQRAASGDRPDRAGRRLRARRRRRHPARQAPGDAGLPRDAADGRRADRRPAVDRRRRARWPRPDLAPPQRKQRTLDALAPQHRGAGRPAADPRRLRGRALDRPDQPRAARPHDRRPAAAAGSAGGDGAARASRRRGPIAPRLRACRSTGSAARAAAELVRQIGGRRPARRCGRARSSTRPTACRCSSRS